MKKTTKAHGFNLSAYPRLKDDDYKTIDSRCVRAFLEHFKPTGAIVDVCSPSGSGIVTTLSALGYPATGCADAFQEGIKADWLVFNPPYKPVSLVNGIIRRQLQRLDTGEVGGVAILLRAYFDFAKKRVDMFRDNPHYFGKIQMLFRPIWFEKRPDVEEHPQHQFVWHIWTADVWREKRLLYADEQQ